MSRVSWTVQTVAVPAASVQTSPGPASISPPSQAIVALPSMTTKSSSDSTSLNTPGVQRQTPLSVPSGDSVSTNDEVRVPGDHLLGVERLVDELRGGGGDPRDQRFSHR